MSLTDIRTLYEYAEWANERMLAAIANLSDEQYTKKIESSFPTIRDTMAHILGAEWIWLQRWNGESPTSHPEWTVDPPVGRLIDESRTIAAQRRKFIETLEESQLDGQITYRNLKGQQYTSRLADILFHIVNHSSYHRGQLTTMIRQAGGTPPTTDLIVFHRERR
jgi:uncharacterized damage-inducible protein DinB